MIFIYNLPASADIILIPGDYPTIQEGIDAANDGDTVLVKPGLYVENINFNGHNIVLGSMFLTTGDPLYIEDTIIDGDSVATVVAFENNEDSTAVITGFTIRNGADSEGGGIRCLYSSPVISHNIITENRDYYINQGAGIYCYYSGAKITDNVISHNVGCWGGGIYCLDSHIVIRRNRIIANEDLW